MMVFYKTYGYDRFAKALQNLFQHIWQTGIVLQFDTKRLYRIVRLTFLKVLTKFEGNFQGFVVLISYRTGNPYGFQWDWLNKSNNKS